MTRSALIAATFIAFAAPALAAAPSLDEAKAELARGELDELYLQFASVKRGQHPAGDAKVSQLLATAARAALDKKDPSLALGLADKARSLDAKNVDASLAAADAAVALDQRGAAEEALEQAHAAAPQNAEVTYRYAEFLEKEGAFERSRELYRSVPKTHTRAAEAKARVDAITELLEKAKGDLAEMKRLEEDAAKRRAAAADSLGGGERKPDDEVAKVPEKSETGGKGATVAVRDATTMKDRVQGLEARSSTNFRIVYTGRGRDFAQRADYEQRLLDLFERARQKVQSIVGQATKGPLDVVLYTRDEFQSAYGGAFANAVAGFYLAGKIRMNASEEVTESFFETAAHEYTHAVIDEAAGKGGVSRWFHEGFAEWTGRRAAGQPLTSAYEHKMFAQAWQTGGVMKLRDYDDGAIVGRGVATHLAYAKAACALDVLLQGSGSPGALRMLGELSRGARFYDAIAHVYGQNRMDTLDAAAEKRCNE